MKFSSNFSFKSVLPSFFHSILHFKISQVFFLFLVFPSVYPFIFIFVYFRSFLLFFCVFYFLSHCTLIERMMKSTSKFCHVGEWTFTLNIRKRLRFITIPIIKHKIMVDILFDSLFLCENNFQTGGKKFKNV